MSNLKKLKELGVELVSGQIMSRVSIKDDSAEPVVETRRVIIPKAINYDGTISKKELPEEKLKVAADEKRRLSRLDSNHISLLEKYGYTEEMAKEKV